MALRRFLHHQAAAVVSAASSLLIIMLAVIFAPWIAPVRRDRARRRPDATESMTFLPPQSAYWFGTDAIGRDLYSPIIWGGRVSLFIGLAVAISASVIGTLVGAFAGFQGGKFDDILMRVTDLFLAFPILVPLLVIRATPEKQAWVAPLFGEPSSIRFIDHAARRSSAGWALARIVRGVVLCLKEKEFVEAAQAPRRHRTGGSSSAT